MAADSLLKASIHEKVGHTGKGLWGHPTWQLPAYMQHVANALIRSRGIDESRASHMAVGIVERWKNGEGKVDAGTRAAATLAWTEWEALRAKAAALRGAKNLANGDRMPDTIDLAGMQAGDLLDAMLKRYGAADDAGKAKIRPGMVGLAKKLGRTKELPADCQPGSSAALSRDIGAMGDYVMRTYGPPVIDLAAFTADQRRQMAAKGQAMKGGGFPIPNKSHLGKAIHAYGRAKNKVAARAHIKKRAKALNASHMLPSSWTGKPKNSGVMTTSMSAERLQGLVDLANTNPRIRKVVIHKIRQKRLRNAVHPVKLRRINPMPKGKRL